MLPPVVVVLAARSVAAEAAIAADRRRAERADSTSARRRRRDIVSVFLSRGLWARERAVVASLVPSRAHARAQREQERSVVVSSGVSSCTSTRGGITEMGECFVLRIDHSPLACAAAFALPPTLRASPPPPPTAAPTVLASSGHS